MLKQSTNASLKDSGLDLAAQLKKKKELRKSTDFVSESISALKNVKIIEDITEGLTAEPIDLELLDSAPNEWNFYRKYNGDEMFELISSIKSNGLLSPIIVWEQEGTNRYTILAGHNRVEAYKKLRDNTQNPDEIRDYLTIPSFVKKSSELSEAQAREIIIDTNFVQRSLSTYEKARSVLEKKRTLQHIKRSSNGTVLAEHIANQYDLSISQVYRAYKLSNLCDELTSLVENGKISLVNAYNLAKLDHPVQVKLFNNYEDKITNNMIKLLKIKDDSSYADIKNQIDDIESSSKTELCNINIKVNKQYKDELMALINNFIKEKEMRDEDSFVEEKNLEN